MGGEILQRRACRGVLKPEMVQRMAARPLVLALANPVPEIMPEEIKAVRDRESIGEGNTLCLFKFSLRKISAANSYWLFCF